MFKVVNLSLKEANEFIAKNHRHHQPVYRDKYRMGVEVDGVLCGVEQVERPVSRHLDDGKTLEVVRLCVLDGVKNACSFSLFKMRKGGGRTWVQQNNYIYS